MSVETPDFRPVNVCQACKQPTPQCHCGRRRECPVCRGRGFNCIDDLCHAQGHCMHDGWCARCEGTGAVVPKRVLVTPDEPAAAIRDFVRENPDIRKGKYAVDDRDPLAGACYPAAEAYYHLNDCEPEVYCLSWDDVLDQPSDATHWYLREPDGDRQFIDITLELMPPVDIPPLAEGTHRGFITGDEPSKRARRIIEAVGGGV